MEPFTENIRFYIPPFLKLIMFKIIAIHLTLFTAFHIGKPAAFLQNEAGSII